MFVFLQPLTMFLRTLVIILCCMYARTFAADKVEINSEPSWLYKFSIDPNRKPPSKEISGGYYFPLFDRQVNLLTQTEYIHVIRQIESEKGVQNASEVSVNFSPAFQQLVFHKVNLWRDGKLLSELKRAQIQVVQEETEASDFLYNGIKRAFVLLKNVQKGDRIEYAYSLIGFNPVFENKYTDEIYFCYDTPISNYFETLIAPVSRTFYLETCNNAPEPVREVNGSVQILRWNNPPLKQWPDQRGTPSWYNSAASTSITEYKTWLDVINWGMRLFNNYQHELPAGLKRKIAEWRNIANGDKDRFATLALNFVQDEVRYLGLEIGVNTHQPHRPAEVYEQLFGDCKDKALLLATILRQEQIPAYVAFVNTDKRAKLADVAPSPLAFDHVIVAIKRSEYLYIDPTISSQKGELVNRYVPAYGYALVIAEKESTLKPVEPGFLYQTSIKEKLEVSCTDSSRLTVVTVYAGGSADDFRGSLANSGMSEMEQTYVKFYDKMYEGISMSGPVVMNDNSVKDEVEVIESYTIPNLTKIGDDGNKTFEVFARLLYNKLPEPASGTSNAPLALEFPMRMQYSLELDMPEETNFHSKPLHIKTDAFEFEFKPEVNGSQLILHYSLQSFKDHIPAEAIRKYKNDYKKMVALMDVEFTIPVRGANNVYSLSGNSTSNTNWPMVYLSFIIIGALAYGLRKLNNYALYPPYEPGFGWPIGGWLVLLGVSLGIHCLLRAGTLMQENFFDKSAWDSLGETTGASGQAALFASLVLSLFWLCTCVGLFYWFLQRRDIFPRVFLWYAGSMIVGELFTVLLYHMAFPDTDLATQKSSDLIGTFVYSIVWGLYIMRSDRVKNTFTEPLG